MLQRLLDRLACWWLDYRQDQRVRTMKHDHPELAVEPGLKRVEIGSHEWEMVATHPGVYMMADEMAAFLEANNAKNYCEFDMMPRLDRGTHPIRVTVQWAYGESPAKKAARLEAEVERLQAQRDGWQEEANRGFEA
jgi:hypothetical protein